MGRNNLTVSDDEDDFPPRIVNEFMQRLKVTVSLPLSPNEKLQLASVARATMEVSLSVCRSDVQLTPGGAAAEIA